MIVSYEVEAELFALFDRFSRRNTTQDQAKQEFFPEQEQVIIQLVPQVFELFSFDPLLIKLNQGPFQNLVQIFDADGLEEVFGYP